MLSAYVDWEEAYALDLFSGTGSIALEFVSRGCPQVTSIEADRDHHAFIKQCMARLGTECSVVVRGDVFKFLNNCHQQFDIIFADPPYALPRLSELPSIVLGSGLLADDGLFVLEHGKQDDFSEMPQFVERRQYGSVNFSLFRNNAFTAAENKKESD